VDLGDMLGGEVYDYKRRTAQSQGERFTDISLDCIFPSFRSDFPFSFF
jgi:hypothetical protein